MRDWETGQILNQYNLDNYEQEWGNVYNMFHRQDMHATLLKAAISSEGKGTPCKVNIDHMYVFSSIGRTRCDLFTMSSSNLPSVVNRWTRKRAL